MTLAPDPRWLEIEQSSDEEDAWLELQARRDRLADYTPAGAPLQLDGRALHRLGVPERSPLPVPSPPSLPGGTGTTVNTKRPAPGATGRAA